MTNTHASTTDVAHHDIATSARILVVEDDDDVRRLIAAVVGRPGRTVDTADDGERAWEMLRSTVYDIVLLDVELPGIDGLEVLRRLRARPEAGRTKVVVVSGLTGRTDVMAARAAGADDHLGKPFRIRQLEDRVDALLTGDGAPDLPDLPCT